MLYPNEPLKTERGLPMEVALELDFEGRSPLASGAVLTFTARRARGDAAVALALSSTRGDIVSTQSTGTTFIVRLRATRAQMMAIPAGDYVYAIVFSGPDFAAFSMVEGAWTHQAILGVPDL